jgi:DNA helicase II / ATP-dependent DNA helicase PcrA
MIAEDSLNKTQYTAATHETGPLLVIAGAGSGKTRIVTHRIAHLISQGVDPDSILAVTFTNKAAREMQERIYQLLKGKGDYAYPTICTFHALGALILRESISALGFTPQFTIYDVEDSQRLLRGCLQTLGVKKDGTLKQIQGIISQHKNQLLSPDAMDFEEVPRELVKSMAEIYKLYQGRLKEANAVDFDDLLFLPVRLFKEHPDVLEMYQNRWKFLLIDEYQDTNHAQYLFARLIVAKTHNIFVVGDPDQSIYSWRGANIQNILNFERDYPGAKVVKLEQNYRSRANILEAANALIVNNSSRLEKNLWSDRGPGDKIVLSIAGTEREEAGFVTYEIQQLTEILQVPLSEIAIFYRTNFQSRIFEDFLLRRHIPYVIVGGISFYQRREIKDVLAFLRMVASDHDTVAFGRTINIPKRGLGETTVEKLRTQSGGHLISYCRQVLQEGGMRLSAKQKEGLHEYCSMIEELRLFSKEQSIQKLLIQTIRASRYFDYLKEDKETFDDRRANVEELISKAHEWELLNENGTLNQFLDEVCLKSSLDESSESEDRLNLMTIHNGKGLEFDYVFVVGMEEDLFPHVNSRDSYDAVEEERRLCYVGMTRAKERLYLTAAETRFLWGTHRTMRPSRFLREIPKEYMERVESL